MNGRYLWPEFLKTGAMVLMASAMILTAPGAMADTSGFYLGGGVGETQVDIDLDEVDDLDFDEDDFAWKVFAGYRTDLLPFFDLAGEIGYRDFGAPERSEVEYEATGVDAFALAILPVGPFEIFAKLGAVWYEQELRVVGFEAFEDDDTTVAWGVGVGARIFGLGARAEWERFEVDEVEEGELDEIEMVSVSAFWLF